MTPILLHAIALASALAAQQNPVRVVTSLTTYASVAREIVGERGTVSSIAEGDEDPHFVQPRPSFVPALRDADLFVTTGMDLELWVPALLDRANNTRIREGGAGYVAAFQGIRLLEVPASLSRSQGDIHIYGNPHIHTDPVSAIIIARNILAGLQRVSPADGAFFAERERQFEQRILRATFGDELVRILTPATLFDLSRSGRVMDFLQRTPYQGRPLITRLGGWMRQAEAFRGRQMVCYHKEWAYFSRWYGVECVEYIEAKPGIPPTPRHVQEVIALMRERHIPVLFASNYFDRNQIRRVAERTGATAVVVPENTHGAPGVETYFDLMTTWVTELARGFGADVTGAR
ncbi:MAG: zinc ABC transporter substrate-binding protein [Gemmatimonadetes bacterium]|nr:zinc ABC transporter substrate-binding protein [Gemmatimonadota bacterium]